MAQTKYYEAIIDPYSRNPRRELVRSDGRAFPTFYYVTGSVRFTHWGKDYDRPLMGCKVGVPVQLVREITAELPPVLRASAEVGS